MCTKSEIDFSINILKALSLDKKCTVFSPFMILKDLAAISTSFDDAAGVNEFIHVFEKEISKPEKAEHYSKLTKDINKDESTSKLLFSSSLFLSDNNTLSSFSINSLQKLKIHYEMLKFTDGKIISAEKMNNFISQNIGNHISDVVSEEDINSEANLFIANGLYFFGEWENPFEYYYDWLWISHESLHLRRNERMMGRTNHDELWNFTEGDNWECLGIPFKGRKLWFHIILPKERLDLASVMEQFNADLLRKCIVKQPSKEIYVAIPIFHMENKFSLMETLPKLGINKNDPLSNVNLGNIFHGARIDVNQLNLPVMTYSQANSDEGHSLNERAFGAFHPFIYFVTLVENDVNELKTLLLLGTFY